MHGKHMRMAVLKGLIRDLHALPDHDESHESPMDEAMESHEMQGMEVEDNMPEVPKPGHQSDEVKKKVPFGKFAHKMG